MPNKHVLLFFSRVLTACLMVAGLAASEHHGVVKSGGLPLPGATVSATQADKKFITTTDDQGVYAFADLPDGVWTIQVEMFGFSKLSREVGVAAEAPSPTWDLPVLSLNAVRQELAAAAKPAAPAAVATANPAPTATTGTNPAPAPAENQRPNRGGFGGGFGRGRGGPGAAAGQGDRPSIRQAASQNGQNPQNAFQRVDVNASADGALVADNSGSGGLGDTQGLADLNQNAADSFVVNGSVSGGLGLPQQNDWFAFGRGFDGGGFGGPGGPGGPGGFGGNQFGAQDGGAQAAGGPGGANAGPGGPGGPGGFGGGGGRGGRGGGGGGFGGPGGFRGGGRGGRGRGNGNLNAFGNGRRNRRAQYNGNLAIILGNSALDAHPYSLTGQNTPKPNFAQFRTTASFGGPLKIPHLISGQKTTFTINFQLARNRNGSVQSLLMPTAAERIGDFSQALNPQTGQPINLSGYGITNNIIPQNLISPQAQAFLNYYPLPNFTGSTRYNYQVPLIAIGNQTNVNVRLNHTINAKNQLSGNFAYQNSDGTNPSVYGEPGAQFLDSTATTGINSSIQYTYHFTTRLISNLRYNFSRQATNADPFLAEKAPLAQEAGIQYAFNQAPQFYGLPGLSFSSGFGGLADGNFSINHNTTNQVGESLLWVRGKHNFTFGTDYRRLDFNQFSQQNARGNFSFTNSYSGFDFANFLLGLPTTSSIAYGNADKYFRESWLDAFVNDSWQLTSKLSLQLGLRWDYQGPVNELYNRLVNLAVGQSFTSITPVCGTAAPGCTLAGAAGYPNSLSRPNYLEFQPRIGLAWRPFTKDSTVVRAGYGLYYNTSVYQALASQMAQQSPLSFSVTQPNSITNPYTMADAFLLPAINSTAQTFALDPNFKIGYLHYWQLSIQHNLPSAFVATVTYNGNKGTHQVQEFLPNTFPSGSIASPYPAGYVYETSGANSNYNAVTTQLQRRFRSGISGNILYTFSKAIDDSQTVGGRGAGGSAYAQNWLDLAAERSVSSFNRTHTLNLQMQWSTGQGAAGGGLLTGWKAVLFKGWTFTDTLTLASGLPETPLLLNRVATGTGITGTVRAEYLGGPLGAVAPGYGFNPAAFGPPPVGQWGNAGRNIITGPAQFSLNAGMGRNFRLGERRNLDLRFDSNNVLNHVTYTSWNSTFGSAQFGLPVSAAAMRTITANLRFRF